MAYLPLQFQTASARTRYGWQAFYLARDRFFHEMLRRRDLGLPFGTYRAPDGKEVDTWLTASDLRTHTLVLGSTGSGKSSLLETLARYHFHRGQGLALIDLHGDLFQRTAAWALATGVRDLTLLDFTHPESIPGWNPLSRMPGVDVGRQVDLLVGVLKRLFAGEKAASWAWGVAVEDIMRHGLAACVESEVNVAFAELRDFFLRASFRRQVLVTASADTQVYFKQWGPREDMYLKGALNRLNPLLGSESVQKFLGARTSTLDPFRVIQTGETLLVNLARGYLGPTAEVIGRMLVNVLQLAALRRESVGLQSRRPFSIILDEAHTLAHAGSGLEDLLVAARKYRVYVTLAAQSLSLFARSFQPHLLGNTGRQFLFRLPYEEARDLAPDIFEPMGNVRREQVRPYDRLDDPLLTPPEELAARTRELANLPVGACYWAIRGKSFRARRIQIAPSKKPPRSLREIRKAQRPKPALFEKPRADEIEIPS
jgi:energy-coupling factor transporter ATP-binding protein EcfA2